MKKWWPATVIAVFQLWIGYTIVQAIQAGGIHGKFRWVSRAADPEFFWFIMGMLGFLCAVMLTLLFLAIRGALQGNEPEGL